MAPAFFAPPGCASREWAPQDWAAEVIREYADERATLLARFQSLTPDVADALGLNASMQQLVTASEANERALRSMLRLPPCVHALSMADTPFVPRSAACGRRGDAGTAYTRARDVLSLLVRDWGPDPAARRLAAQLVGLLTRFLPPASSHVHVPAAGACGLAYALAARGFRVDASDASLPVLAAAYSVLSGARERVHPLAHADADLWRRADVQLGTPIHARRLGGAALRRLTLQPAPFPETVLGNHIDAIVTHFAIDALPASVAETVGHIANTLRPGGVWLNAGPLLYHSDSQPPLTHDELLTLVRHRNMSVRLRRTAHVRAYDPEPRAATLFGVQSFLGFGRLLRALVCVAQSVRSLPPEACASSALMSSRSYDIGVFVAVRQ